MAFKYRGKERKTEDVVRRSKQAGGSYDSILSPDISMFKAREGEGTVRILPPTWDLDGKWGNDWAIQIYMHYGVGPDEASYLCSDKLKGEPCPVCEARRDADGDEAQQLKPSWRALCWIIDRANEKAGPQVWSMPATVFREINNRSVNKKTNAVICIDDPEEGYDVVFNRVGTDLRTDWNGINIDQDPSPIHDDEKKQARWLKYIEENPLPDCLNFYDPDYIEKVLSGKVEKRRRKAADEDDEDQEEAPRQRRTARAAAEDDDEDEAPRSRRGRAEPEEEDEDEAPRRRRRASADEDDEEQEAPSRRRPRTAATEEDEEESPRSRRRPKPEAEEEEEELPFEAKGKGNGKAAASDDADEEEAAPSRRRARTAAAEDEDEDEAPAKQAKRKLERLKSRASK